VLAGADRFGQAVGAAQAAVDADPLRGSPHAVLMAVHMREGNRPDALRDFERYRARLDAALGLELTPRLRALPPAEPAVALPSRRARILGLWRSRGRLAGHSCLGRGGLQAAAARVGPADRRQRARVRA
jgi:hypothetical protein